MHIVFPPGRLHPCLHHGTRGVCQARARVHQTKCQADWAECQRQRVPSPVDQGHRRDHRLQPEVSHCCRSEERDCAAVRYDRLPRRHQRGRQRCAVDHPFRVYNRQREEDQVDHDLPCELWSEHRRGLTCHRFITNVREVVPQGDHADQLGSWR